MDEPLNLQTDNPITDIRTVTRAIEAILFAAGHPVSYEKLSDVLGLPPREVHQLCEHMALAYNGEESERGILLICAPETAQLCTREEFAPYIREALGIRRGGNLSTSSLEVLSIVAYNQPVTRSYIDAVRGVDSAYAVGALLDKNLIEPCGRLDAPGRPMLYATTPDFLRVFGLSSLGDLPDGDALALASASKYDEVKGDEAAVEAEAEVETEAEAEVEGEAEVELPEAEVEVEAESAPDPDDSTPDPEEELPEGAVAFDAEGE